MISACNKKKSPLILILILFLSALLCHSGVFAQNGSGEIRVEATDTSRMVYSPPFADGTWNTTHPNDEEIGIGADDTNFQLTFQYTGECDIINCSTQMLTMQFV